MRLGELEIDRERLAAETPLPQHDLAIEPLAAVVLRRRTGRDAVVARRFHQNALLHVGHQRGQAEDGRVAAEVALRRISAQGEHAQVVNAGGRVEFTDAGAQREGEQRGKRGQRGTKGSGSASATKSRVVHGSRGRTHQKLPLTPIDGRNGIPDRPVEPR